MPSTTATPILLDSNLNIRVSGKRQKTFNRVCAASGTDPSCVVRALMDEVIECGIAYHPHTGAPTIAPTKPRK